VGKRKKKKKKKKKYGSLSLSSLLLENGR